MMLRSLSVRLYGKHTGTLSQDEAGKMAFQYADGAQNILTLCMPIQEEFYPHETCEAYFGGLLPESEPARLALGKTFGINPHDSFSLLRVIGHDCAGAVSLHDVNEPENETDLLPLKGKVLQDGELAQHIIDLPRKPLFIGVDGLRLSLAGAQDKAAVCLIEGQVALPQNGSPTTHILKPNIEYLGNTVENEYLCLKIAEGMGFSVPKVEMRMANKVPYLLIERYDREVVDNKLRRLHQEDFCQALRIITTYKYQTDGGPGFEQCFEVLKKTVQPAKARIRLAEIAIFNYLIGNTDAHGKNFSLLYSSSGSVTLAPFYDLLCAQAYSRVTNRMAMEIGGVYEISNVRAEDWKNFSKSIGFTYPVLRKMIQTQAERLMAVAALERDKLKDTPFDTKVLGKMLQYFQRQIFDVTKRLA